MPAMMAGSERRCSEAGVSLPDEAWTIDIESSTVTDCRPVACMSSSVRPRQGRTNVSFATSKCERLSLVARCTLRSSFAIDAKDCSASGRATAKLPPRQISALAEPSIMARSAATASCPVRAGRLETQGLFNAVQERLGRLFGNADGPVPLHVGVSAQRADARAGFSEVAFEQQQVGNQTNVRRSLVVLCDPHAIGDDRRVRFRIRDGHPLEIGAGETAGLFDVGPIGRVQVCGERLEAFRMRGDERMVQHVPLFGIHRKQRFHDALEGRRVAARIDLEIGGGDSRRAIGGHFDPVLRIGEALQCTLTQRVEYDDRYVAP